MKTEYLIPLDVSKGFAENEKAFNHLLMANSGIDIKGNKIKYRNKEFEYTIQSNRMDNSNINCYHVTVIANIDATLSKFDDEDLGVYLELLRIMRITFSKYTTDFEILWDDVSFWCSQKAYPLIYQIENLTRKLLTKFMLINIGKKWEKENIPSKIGKSVHKEKEINFGNSLLYRLDFRELSPFLFEPYSTKNTLVDLEEYIVNKDEQLFSLLGDYIPKSNWERYFSDVVEVEDEHFKKKWDELYDLRCKVAHNNLFGINDLNRTIAIVEELKPSIEKAIEKLDRITVPEEEKETIAENLVSNSSELVGMFLLKYNTLVNIINKKVIEINGDNKEIIGMPITKMAALLNSFGIFDETIMKKLQRIRVKRNQIVHSTCNVSEDEFRELMKIIDEIIYYIENFNEEEKIDF